MMIQLCSINLNILGWGWACEFQEMVAEDCYNMHYALWFRHEFWFVFWMFDQGFENVWSHASSISDEGWHPYKPLRFGCIAYCQMWRRCYWPLNSKKKFSSTEHLRSCGTTSSTALISSFLFMFLCVSKFSLVPQGLPGVDHSYEVRGASCTCMCSVFWQSRDERHQWIC